MKESEQLKSAGKVICWDRERPARNERENELEAICQRAAHLRRVCGRDARGLSNHETGLISDFKLNQ